MLTECIILAGGLGTRLRTVVNDLPKVLAPVNDKPFLHYLLTNAHQQGITRFVLSTGYLHEKIQAYIGQFHGDKEIEFAVEEEPLGTGGAIAYALGSCKTNSVLILNGDTFFDISYNELYSQHVQSGADFSIALKKMKGFDRYGTVIIDAKHRITAFREKQLMEEGLINGGIYIVEKNRFEELIFPAKFSMEKDYMEKLHVLVKMYGFAFDSYFKDIGIPTDYEEAQLDFKNIF